MRSKAEEKLQTLCVKWARAMVGKYPELSALIHYPAEVGNRSDAKGAMIEGAKMKRLGKAKGFPDLFLPVPKGGYGGLFIELKAKKGEFGAKTDGKLSVEQESWLAFLNKQGNLAVMIDNFEDFKKVVEEYLNK